MIDDMNSPGARLPWDERDFAQQRDAPAGPDGYGLLPGAALPPAGGPPPLPTQPRPDAASLLASLPPVPPIGPPPASGPVPPASAVTRRGMMGRPLLPAAAPAAPRAGGGAADAGPPIVVTAQNARKVRAMTPDQAQRYQARYDKRQRGLQGGGLMSPAEVERHAAHAMQQYQRNLRDGMDPDSAAAWAANSEAESGGDFRSKQHPKGPGRGLYQWGADNPKFDRRRDFRRVMGVDIENSTEDQQVAFRNWELQHTESGARKRIEAARGAGAKGAAIALYYERPSEKDRRAIDRWHIAEAIARHAGGGGGG